MNKQICLWRLKLQWLSQIKWNIMKWHIQKSFPVKHRYFTYNLILDKSGTWKIYEDGISYERRTRCRICQRTYKNDTKQTREWEGRCNINILLILQRIRNTDDLSLPHLSFINSRMQWGSSQVSITWENVVDTRKLVCIVWSEYNLNHCGLVSL